MTVLLEKFTDAARNLRAGAFNMFGTYTDAELAEVMRLGSIESSFGEAASHVKDAFNEEAAKVERKMGKSA